MSCAREAALRGFETVLIEAALRLGGETTSRNSEVIHSGLYYPTGSLKAAACVQGQRELYAYLEERGVAFNRSGKLIVATSEDEVTALEGLFALGRANGVQGLQRLNSAEAQSLEPALSCLTALFAPNTGVFDSHAYMQSLQGDFEGAGGAVVLGSRLVGGDVSGPRIRLDIKGPDGISAIQAEIAVLCAGLESTSVLEALQGLPRAGKPQTYYAKGTYFRLVGPSPFKRLVYPAPGPAGLGIHATLDLAGSTRFGPDVEWVDRIDYAVDPGRATYFQEAVRRYWPSLPNGVLEPDYAGIRPKLAPEGAPPADFAVLDAADHGVPGLVCMCGIESPGLTASLYLGRFALDKALAQRG
jgi:L-2-hydroxyglutarate oxidase LhgO